MSYEIEENIPIVMKCKKYPFHKMGIGDSFSLPEDEFRRIHSASYSWGKGHNAKFTIKKISDTHYRCWRVS